MVPPEYSPYTWDFNTLYGIPKAKKMKAFDKYRWLDPGHILHNVYMEMTVVHYQDRIVQFGLSTYDFKRGHATMDAFSIPFELIHYAKRGSLPLLNLNRDVLTAFDETNRCAIPDALLESGVA